MTAVRLSAPSYEQTFGSGGVSSVANEIDREAFDQQPLQSEEQKIRTLSSDMGAPTIVATSLALQILRSVFVRAVRLGSWTSPHITLSENNEVVFEWWNGAKKITLYCGEANPEYIKVWGTDIENEMESGLLVEGWNLTSLWLWLYP